ncbi:MAG: ThiF family adenylyltransferase [Flavobacteriales bacterium]
MQTSTRYDRQVILPFVGVHGQQVLQNAWVVVIGVGGLGCPAAVALAGAGVGRLTLVDPDSVSLSNLHRQMIFSNEDIGKKKVEVAVEFLRNRAGHIQIDALNCAVEETEHLDFWENCNVIIDGTDNFQARFFINDMCAKHHKPLIYGGVFQTQFHIAIFHKTNAGGQSFDLRDLYPSLDSAQTAKSCNLAGVLPTTTGVLGNIQAQWALACLIDLNVPIGQLIVMDLMTMNASAIAMVSRESDENNTKELSIMIKEITVDELADLREAGAPYTLIDVRENDEFDACEMGGTLIPMSEMGTRWSEIPKDGRVIIHCRSGMRSANVIRFLQEQQGYSNLENLKGGILAWIAKFDPTKKTF